MKSNNYIRTIPTSRVTGNNVPTDYLGHQDYLAQNVVASSASLLDEINKWASLYAEIKAIKSINKQIADKLPRMLKSFTDNLPKGKPIKFNAIFIEEGNKNFVFADLRLLQQRIQDKKGTCSAKDVIVEHPSPSLVSSKYYFPITIMLFTEAQIEFSKKYGNNKTFGIIYTN